MSVQRKDGMSTVHKSDTGAYLGQVTQGRLPTQDPRTHEWYEVEGWFAINRHGSEQWWPTRSEAEASLELEEAK